MALFGNTRKPRKFDYRPIYHDPRKAALDRRVEEIRDQLIDKGEIAPSEADLQRREQSQGQPHYEERLHDKLHRSLRRNMTHLTNQESKGKAGSGRKDEIFRILLLLVLLALVVWFLYYRR